MTSTQSSILPSLNMKTRKQHKCFNVSKRRYRGGTSSAAKREVDAKTLMKKVKKCSKDVSAKLKEYHNDPAGEEAFTRLMTEILTQARDVNSTLVRTMLKNLEPKGEYKVNTLSNEEIDRVCRKMHADREFMKRQKWLILSCLSWVYIIILSIAFGKAFGTVLYGFYFKDWSQVWSANPNNNIKTNNAKKKTRTIAACIFTIFTKMSLTEFKKCSQNIHKLEEILATY